MRRHSISGSFRSAEGREDRSSSRDPSGSRPSSWIDSSGSRPPSSSPSFVALATLALARANVSSPSAASASLYACASVTRVFPSCSRCRWLLCPSRPFDARKRFASGPRRYSDANAKRTMCSSRAIAQGSPGARPPPPSSKSSSGGSRLRVRVPVPVPVSVAVAVAVVSAAAAAPAGGAPSPFRGSLSSRGRPPADADSVCPPCCSLVRLVRVCSAMSCRTLLSRSHKKSHRRSSVGSLGFPGG